MDSEPSMKPHLRVLLVEDDSTSRAVLAAALQGLPADVDAVPDMRTALAHASRHRHALWLLDAHLPDGTGIDLLARLRAMDPRAVAVAHTASRDAGLARALREAGFVDVLVKPMPAAALRDAVRRVLQDAAPVPAGDEGTADASADASTDAHALPLLDDAAAAAALGDPVHVAALRALFATELAGYASLEATDPAGVQSALHRLRASCGFVGAARLGWAAAQWQQRMDRAAHATFVRILDDTRVALDGVQAGTTA